MATNRLVGGLYCFEVLDRLSEYLDGELDEVKRREVEAHLSGCDECTRFGGEFGAVVKAVRERLGAAGDVPAEVARRLDDSLRR